MPWLMLIPVLLLKMLHYMGRCCCPCFINWQMLLPFFVVAVGRPLHYMFQLWRWQILLPSDKMEQQIFIALKMVDVIAMWQDGTATFYSIRRWQMLLPYGRWNSHYVYCEKMADVILPSGRWNYHLGWLMVLGRCYNQVGRWNSHRVYYLMLFLVLRCYAEPYPRCVAGGICLCFYSGMDYWPLSKELPWWFSLGSGPLSPLC